MKPVCEVTHPQITAGKCPWCDEPIGAGNSEDPAGETVWNVDAMAAALDDVNPPICFTSLSNLRESGLPLAVLLPLFAKALRSGSEDVAQVAEQELLRLGRNLSDDALSLEAAMSGSPNELAARILHLSRTFGSRRAKATAVPREESVYWLIEHAPESQTAGMPYASLDKILEPDSYDKAKELWMKQVGANPASAKVQANAAKFFMLHDKSLCEGLLKKARDLEPSNPQWAEQLGHFYSLQSLGRGRREGAAAGRTEAASAFREFSAARQLREQERPQTADTTRSEEQRANDRQMEMWNLSQLAKAAFEACEFEHARNHATEVLERAASLDLPESERNDGIAIHYGNLILGRLALREGDIERAKQYLIASGKTNGAATLNSFGPSMILAQELLERGESETVLRYFDLCGKFWKRGSETLKKWSQQVHSGEAPEFGGNLIY